MKHIYTKIMTFCSFLFTLGCSQPVMVKEKYSLWGKEHYLPKKGQNTPLHLQILESSNKTPKACILMVHGMNEYIGRYKEIAQYFSKDFLVVGFDLTAHGLSNPYLAAAHREIEKGATEYNVSSAFLEQAQFTNLDLMRNDMNLALDYIVTQCSKNQADLPIFILSHSLGSLVSASYLLENHQNNKLKQRLAGIIFTGPAFSVTKVPGWRGIFQNPFIDFSFYLHQHFLHPQNEPLPQLAFNQIVSFMITPVFDGLFKIFSLPIIRDVFSPSAPDWVIEHLSDWEVEREKQRTDGYILRRTVLAYVLGIEKEIIRFRKKMENFKFPYLLVYSEHDPITPAWGNTDFAELTLKHHQDNELMLLKDANHHEQLFSKPALRQKVLEKIHSWMQKRLTAQ